LATNLTGQLLSQTSTNQFLIEDVSHAVKEKKIKSMSDNQKSGEKHAYIHEKTTMKNKKVI